MLACREVVLGAFREDHAEIGAGLRQKLVRRKVAESLFYGAIINAILEQRSRIATDLKGPKQHVLMIG
jgi:hypothetical protein